MTTRSREALLSELREIGDRAATADARGGELRDPASAALLGSGRPAGDGRGPVKLVVGIEDTTYFHWQLPILFESLVGQMPDGWEAIAVVCNGHRRVSEELRHTFATYEVRHFTGAHHPSSHDIDFSGGGGGYAPLNKIEALNAIAERVDDDDRICLLDTDNFLYRDLDPSVFPEGDAVCETWVVAEQPFFTLAKDPGAVDLAKLLQSIGGSGEFARGGVAVFLRGRTLRDSKFVKDCFRFTQVVFLLGRIAGVERIWTSEMPCYALALAANDIQTELISNDRFVIDNRKVVEPGSFYHYYVDFADGKGEGAFHKSPWCKQEYRDRHLLDADLAALEAAALSDQERVFFALARRARERLQR